MRRRSTPPKINSKQRARQIAFLRAVRSYPDSKLRRTHHEYCERLLSEDHRWRVVIPRHVPRFFIERRLFNLFVIEHFHLDRSLRKQFIDAVNDVMCQTWGAKRRIRSDKLLADHLHDLRERTPESLLKESPEEVERLLLSLGYVVDADHRTKVFVLLEVAQRRPGDFGPQFGRGLAARSSPRLTATDVVRAHPNKTGNEILEIMPTLTFSKKCLKDARWKMRKLGYELPAYGDRQDPEPDLPDILQDDIQT